uniref:Uncharacterized protein n=1 Tax=Amphimedon queenslandica TaxID=400682 RepID=A0A1X7VAK0_AMPQE
LKMYLQIHVQPVQVARSRKRLVIEVYYRQCNQSTELLNLKEGKQVVKKMLMDPWSNKQ